MHAHLSCRPASGTERLLSGLPEAFSSTGSAYLSQPFPIGEVFQTSDHFRDPPLDPLHVFTVLRAPELDTGLHVGSQRARSRGAESPPSATLLLMQPSVWLAFWAASAHCRLMSSFSSSSTHKSFSAGLLS